MACICRQVYSCICMCMSIVCVSVCSIILKRSYVSSLREQTSLNFSRYFSIDHLDELRRTSMIDMMDNNWLNYVVIYIYLFFSFLFNFRCLKRVTLYQDCSSSINFENTSRLKWTVPLRHPTRVYRISCRGLAYKILNEISARYSIKYL